MTKVVLSHNPYLKETFIQVDGSKLSNENCIIAKIKDQPSGMWVESILGDIIEECNLSAGKDKLNVTFCGTREDFEDLEASIDETKKRTRVDIQLTHKELPAASWLIEELHSFFNEFEKFEQTNPSFMGTTFDKDKKDFQDAMLPNADVNVIATMSSGKSTLINSLIGQELLPAANQATTATITRILDNDSKVDFSAKRIGENNQILETKEIGSEDKSVINEWNKNPETLEIHLEGNIAGVEQTLHSRLMLVDTPGPNNSQNKEHGLTTARILDDEKMSVVLYVLNATQLGISDDCSLLQQVKKAMEKGGKQAHDRFMFVVNKIDEFDPEKGESVESALQKIREYLGEKIGIKNPNIYPVSAMTALLIRKNQLKHNLTRSEKSDLGKSIVLFTEEPTMNMLQYMPVSPNVNRIIQSKLANASTPEEIALIKSGIPILEAVINEYIEKYALPSRVNKCFGICDQLIQGLTDKEKAYADLLEANKVDEEEEKIILSKLHELGEVADLVEQAKSRPALSTNFKAGMSQKAGEYFKGLAADLNPFSGQVDPILGRRKFNDMIALAEYSTSKYLVELEKLLDKENKNVINELQSSYMDKVKAIFDTNDSFAKLIELELRSVDFTRILNPFADQPEVVSEKVRKTGTRTVEKRTWRRLWLWASEVEEEYTYFDTIEFIDLDYEVTKIISKTECYSNEIMDKVSLSAQDNRKKLIEKFASDVQQKLSEKSQQITGTRNKLLKDRETRQSEITNQAKIIAEINEIKNKFKKISSFN